MTPERRTLGTTNLQISTVGFGAWAVGGDWFHGWGPQDDNASIAAIRHAVELGVNWIDTAAIYGLGHSEEVVGRALRAIPLDDRPYVFTKGGLIPDRSRPFEEPVRDLRPTVIRQEVEASLVRLGSDRIDLYQFHWPDQLGARVEDSWAEMGRLVDEGKVRYAGVCNFDVDLLARAEAIRHVDTLQPPFSMIRRDSGGAEIPWAAEHRTGVIVYSPMQSGILTDTFSADRVAAMAETDWRRAAPNFNEPALGRNLALRDTLRPIADRHGTTVAAVAIGWVLAWPGVTGAIVGARSPEQVDGWIGGSQIRLTEDDLAEIANAITAVGAGSGPVHSLVAIA
jgi:aryl-alcohol dehydrogenase-like predicted oxidoreductase